MSGTGEQIVQALQSVRAFHTSVAKLLNVATSTIAEHGWAVPSRTAACGSNGSKSASNPRYWMPEDGFQFYRNKANRAYLAFVAVIFDDAKNPDLVTEPITSAGWLRFTNDGPGALGECYAPWCRTALIAGGSTNTSGQWRDVEASLIPYHTYYQIESARVMACPLMSIGSEEDLTRRIVEPLLNELAMIGPKAVEP